MVLPKEIWIIIFDYIDLDDVKKVTLTCSLFNNIIKNRFKFLYKINDENKNLNYTFVAFVTYLEDLYEITNAKKDLNIKKIYFLNENGMMSKFNNIFKYNFLPKVNCIESINIDDQFSWACDEISDKNGWHGFDFEDDRVINSVKIISKYIKKYHKLMVSVNIINKNIKKYNKLYVSHLRNKLNNTQLKIPQIGIFDNCDSFSYSPNNFINLKTLVINEVSSELNLQHLKNLEDVSIQHVWGDYISIVDIFLPGSVKKLTIHTIDKNFDNYWTINFVCNFETIQYINIPQELIILFDDNIHDKFIENNNNRLIYIAKKA